MPDFEVKTHTYYDKRLLANARSLYLHANQQYLLGRISVTYILLPRIRKRIRLRL